MKFSQTVTTGCLSSTALALLLAAGSAYSQTTKTPQEPITQDFETLDENDDGFVSRQEADDENVWYHFTAIDADRDHKLSKDEFVNYIRQEEPLLGEQLPLEELPQAYLRERTGVGSNADVVTNPELLPKIQTEFAGLDNDGDGFISLAEAADDYANEHFTHIDINDDGMLSEYEFETYLREHGTEVATQDVVRDALYRQ
jgi:Ca2+-binding EF-hand superfamily protein